MDRKQWEMSDIMLV